MKKEKIKVKKKGKEKENIQNKKVFQMNPNSKKILIKI